MNADTYIEKIALNRFPLWENRKPLLSSLDLELTERCNNNCIHCYINQPADSKDHLNKELSTDEIKQTLDEAASLGCLYVRMTGGEPLLREDFIKIYLYIRRLGMKVKIFTNATLINSDIAVIFSTIPPLEDIEITVYGMHQASYEAITRNPGSFDKAFRGIALLKEYDVPFIVKTVLLPPNIDDLPDIEKWASALSNKNRTLSYTSMLDMRGKRDSETKNIHIQNLRLTPESVLTYLNRNKKDDLGDMPAYCQKFMGVTGKKLFTCGAGLGSGSLDAYGHFQMCLQLRHSDSVFDLKKGSLKDALGWFKQIRKTDATNPDYLNRCAKCFIKCLCEQCPAKSWMEHGELDKPVEYLCKIAHIQAVDLGLLNDSEKGWGVDDWEDRLNIFIKTNPSQSTQKTRKK